MCKGNYTRTNKPFESTTSTWRTETKLEERLNITPDKRVMFRHCLERAIAKTALKEENKYRKEDFFKDAAVRVTLLIESKPFQEWCQENQLNEFATATHISMMGITAIKRVLCDDIINEGRITLEVSKDYNIPIFTPEELDMESVNPASTSDEQQSAA